MDRCQRELEQAVSDVLDPDGTLDALIEQARGRYRKLAEDVQLVFTKHLETEGWPPSGGLANAGVFDRFVAPVLGQSGRGGALFLVDALRCELGVALQQQLAEDEAVELLAAAAQLPTITSVGMASLLPGAGSRLYLARQDDALVPMLDDTPAANLAQRLDVLKKRFGDRFEALKLTDFARGKAKLPAQVDLLVLRSVEILLEAHDKQGRIVGEAKAGGPVNPATGTVTLQPGQSRQVTIRMQMDFEGKFRLKALNPTTLETYAELALETDYAV
ncbi:PglZ domain-containing protein [uncultured Thiohalocapsa sp.]|uniref:PglZ domain-containing protein n=1 Tax=uncultured Thiohalocapsa sp. TaxID=768990 RepID=UPI0025D35993|nr:PglZ domain-containing protein [uncultured Thiohalocapsa sp.]